MAANLFLAALLHDVGSPPFSHLTEDFQHELTGMNHEEFVKEALKEEKLKQLIKKNKGELSLIIKMIQGELSPWGDLINGSIDLDNLDNSLRWGLGAGVFKTKFYEPEEIVNAFMLQKGKLVLNISYQSNILKWELARRLVYDLVYSDVNLGPGSMVSRALYFAFINKEITQDFFYLTDSQAFFLLENRFNPACQKLAQAARFWHFYLLAGKKETEKPSKKLKNICLNWKQKFQLADKIALNLKIAKEDVCLYAGKDKGFKRIHLPFVGDEQRKQHLPLVPLKWRVKVYLHPKHKSRLKEFEEVITKLIP